MGPSHRSPFTNLYRCHSYLRHMSSDTQKLPAYKDQEELRYYPGLYNLAFSILDAFDFDDWWTFDLVLERIDPDDTETSEPVLLATHGKAPSQYPDYDDYA
jgi:hypothetical protein